LGELFGEGTLLAVGEVLEAEVLVELDERLLVGEAAEEGFCSLLAAEKADAAALEFLVHCGVAEFVIVFVGAAFLVEGKGYEVVG